MLPPPCAIRAGGINCATFFMALPRAGRPVGFASCDGYRKVINDIPAPTAYYPRNGCGTTPLIVSSAMDTYFGHRIWLVGVCPAISSGRPRSRRCGMGTLLEKKRIRFAQAINARVLAVMQQRREDKSQNYERKKIGLYRQNF